MVALQMKKIVLQDACNVYTVTQVTCFHWLVIYNWFVAQCNTGDMCKVGLQRMFDSFGYSN